MAEDVLCRCTNLDGTECTRHRTPGEKTCWWHQPDRVEDRARKLEAQAAAVRASISAAVEVAG